MSLNLPNAIDSTGDVSVIDYSLLQVSKGSLPGVDDVKVEINAAGITFTGDTLLDYPKAQTTDVITVLLKKANGALKAVKQPRGEGETFTAQIAMSGITAADVEFVYVFVNSADGTKASNSVYVPIG
jgi:hypothetical protein